MKKLLICVLSVLIVLSLLAACGKNGGSTEPADDGSNADALSVKTIGEALAFVVRHLRESLCLRDRKGRHLLAPDG